MKSLHKPFNSRKKHYLWLFYLFAIIGINPIMSCNNTQLDNDSLLNESIFKPWFSNFVKNSKWTFYKNYSLELKCSMDQDYSSRPEIFRLSDRDTFSAVPIIHQNLHQKIIHTPEFTQNNRWFAINSNSEFFFEEDDILRINFNDHDLLKPLSLAQKFKRIKILEGRKIVSSQNYFGMNFLRRNLIVVLSVNRDKNLSIVSLYFKNIEETFETIYQNTIFKEFVPMYLKDNSTKIDNYYGYFGAISENKPNIIQVFSAVLPKTNITNIPLYSVSSANVGIDRFCPRSIQSFASVWNLEFSFISDCDGEPHTIFKYKVGQNIIIKKIEFSLISIDYSKPKYCLLKEDKVVYYRRKKDSKSWIIKFADFQNGISDKKINFGNIEVEDVLDLICTPHSDFVTFIVKEKNIYNYCAVMFDLSKSMTSNKSIIVDLKLPNKYEDTTISSFVSELGIILAYNDNFGNIKYDVFTDKVFKLEFRSNHTRSQQDFIIKALSPYNDANNTLNELNIHIDIINPDLEVDFIINKDEEETKIVDNFLDLEKRNHFEGHIFVERIDNLRDYFIRFKRRVTFISSTSTDNSFKLTRFQFKEEKAFILQSRNDLGVFTGIYDSDMNQGETKLNEKFNVTYSTILSLDNKEAAIYAFLGQDETLKTEFKIRLIQKGMNLVSKSYDQPLNFNYTKQKLVDSGFPDKVFLLYLKDSTLEMNEVFYDLNNHQIYIGRFKLKIAKDVIDYCFTENTNNKSFIVYFLEKNTYESDGPPMAIKVVTISRNDNKYHLAETLIPYNITHNIPFSQIAATKYKNDVDRIAVHSQTVESVFFELNTINYKVQKYHLFYNYPGYSFVENTLKIRGDYIAISAISNSEQKSDNINQEDSSRRCLFLWKIPSRVKRVWGVHSAVLFQKDNSLIEYDLRVSTISDFDFFEKDGVIFLWTHFINVFKAGSDNKQSSFYIEYKLSNMGFYDLLKMKDDEFLKRLQTNISLIFSKLNTKMLDLDDLVSVSKQEPISKNNLIIMIFMIVIILTVTIVTILLLSVYKYRNKARKNSEIHNTTLNLDEIESVYPELNGTISHDQID